MLENLAFLSCL